MRGPSQPRKNAPQSACLSASSQKLPVATSHEVRRAQSKKKRFGDTSHGIVKVKKLLISPQYRKNRSATLRVVPTGSTSLRNAETPRLTTYVAQLHAWPFTNKKSTAKRVPQHSITKVAGGNVLWITPDFSPADAIKKKRFGDTPNGIIKVKNAPHLPTTPQK